MQNKELLFPNNINNPGENVGGDSELFIPLFLSQNLCKSPGTVIFFAQKKYYTSDYTSLRITSPNPAFIFSNCPIKTSVFSRFFFMIFGRKKNQLNAIQITTIA